MNRFVISGDNERAPREIDNRSKEERERRSLELMLLTWSKSWIHDLVCALREEWRVKRKSREKDEEKRERDGKGCTPAFDPPPSRRWGCAVRGTRRCLHIEQRNVVERWRRRPRHASPRRHGRTSLSDLERCIGEPEGRSQPITVQDVPPIRTITFSTWKSTRTKLYCRKI